MSNLITVELNNIPEMFHTSRIFKARDQLKNRDQIILFENVCNFELKMNNYIEICRALETLRYWNFAKTPECFYNTVLSKKLIIRDIILKNEYNMILMFQTLKPFAEMCVLTISDPSEMRQIAENLELVDLIKFIDV